MTPETLYLLEQLQNLEWFHAVRQPNCGQTIAAEVCSRLFTWKEALASAQLKLSANVQLESRNVLTENLCITSPSRFRDWNGIMTVVRQHSGELVAGPVAAAVGRNKQRMTPKLHDYLHGDVICACMELEYADLNPPRLFKDRLDWYLAGHFPCGWDGDFPEGRFIVY